MTTQTHTNNATRSAGHPSMKVLTGGEADAIVGGGLIGSIEDAVCAARRRFREALEWVTKHKTFSTLPIPRF